MHLLVAIRCYGLVLPFLVAKLRFLIYYDGGGGGGGVSICGFEGKEREGELCEVTA